MPKLEFLNVDLELLFAEEPKGLLRELGRKIFVLYSGEHPEGYLVALELGPYLKNPEKVFRRWIKFLRAISPKAKRELRKALSRTFDLGFEICDDPEYQRLKLPADLLTDIARLGASYVITLYQADAPGKFRLIPKRLRK